MGIFSTAKEVANVLREAGKIEEYKKILDLIDDLFDKSEKIETLEMEKRNLQKQLRIKKDEYTFINNAYYNRQTKDGPFCSHCFDKNTELIRIISNQVRGNYATCPECKNTVNYTGYEMTYKQPKPRSFE